MELRPGAPALSRGVVHVWSARLDQPPSLVSRFLPTLSPDERHRAGGCQSEADRARIVVACGLVRQILAEYLEMPPVRIEYSYSAAGKPSLSRRMPARTLTFDTADSAGLALVAVTVGRRIGVALGEVRAVEDAQEIAHSTCKRAYVRARGDVPATHAAPALEVASGADGRVRLFGERGSGREAAHWRLEQLSPAPGYVGAVVVEGYDWTLAGLEALP